jgi:hypothetical protein
MVDLAEIQAAYYMVAATGVLVAAVYYIINIRATQRNMKENLETRQTQLFMQIFQRFQDQGFTVQYNILMDRTWNNLDDYMKRYEGNPSPDGASLLSIQTYFEGVGVLLMKKMIDVDTVYELMPTMATTFWKRYEPIVIQIRKEWGYPQFFRPVEYLSSRLVEHARLRGDPVVTAYNRSSVGVANTQ